MMKQNLGEVEKCQDFNCLKPKRCSANAASKADSLDGSRYHQSLCM